MKIKYKTNFAGYFPLLRAILLLLKDNTLNFTQLGAYLCFVAQADFDRKHPYYTVIIRDDSELANEWGCSSSTVNRKRKELIKIGLLYENDGLTRIKNFSMFELEWLKTLAKVPPTITKTFYAKTLDEIAESFDTIAEMHSDPPQNDAQSSNVPSKRESSFFNSEDIDIDKVISDMEEQDKKG